MSEENVEIVRRGNAAFNGGDVDAFVEKFVAPDAELQDLRPGRSLRGNGLSTRTSVRPSSATHRVQVEQTEKAGGEERSYGDSLACDPA